MSHRLTSLLAALLIGCGLARAQEVESKLIQGFEEGAKYEVWPADAKAELKTDWAAEGKQSVLLHKGTMIAVSDMATHDWSGYQVWRFHVRVPGKEGVTLGLELADKEPTHLNRHQNSSSAPPGDSVVEIDIAGDLWRGEVNKPYRMVKTPLDKKNIVRFGITAQSADIYVDKIELVKVKAIAADGAFAFDLGRPGSVVQSQWIGITNNTKWDDAKGYGMTPGARPLNKDTPYPTPVMGDGLVLNDASLEVKLKGGKYIGWAIFERSGFWENEQGLFTKLTLKANGQSVLSRDAKLDDPFFLFQDCEVLDQQGVNAMVMDRQMAGDIVFEAKAGKNGFTMDVEGASGFAPRLAGLVLAPDTAEGRAFIDAHKKLQADTITATHRVIDRSEMHGVLAAADAGGPIAREIGPLMVTALPTDAAMHPRDTITREHSAVIPPIQSMAGLTGCRLLGLWSFKDFAAVRPILSDLKGEAGTIPASAARLLVNHYMPVHGYDQTACWIEGHDYRSKDIDVRPNLARALLVMIDVPADAKAGTYAGTLELTHKGELLAAIPITLKVAPGTIPLADWPIGLFSSGVTIPRTVLGDEMYWKLAEDVLGQLHRASLTMLTGGPNFQMKWDGKTPVFSGDDAVRLLALAKKHGLDRMMTNYGGLSIGVGRGVPKGPGMGDDESLAAIFKAWEAFRAKHSLPDFLVYAYDEPGTDAEFGPLAGRLKALRAAGFKTIGYTSMADPAKADDHHKMLAKETTHPGYNIHSPATLKFVRDLGNEPWIYNNGLDRTGMGIHLWRNHRAGAGGRIQWIGSVIQGFQYDALDSREPDLSCFYFHKTQGILLAPRFLGALEGGIDARLLFELEKRAKAKPEHPASAKIAALFKSIEARPYDRAALEWSVLEDYRGQMLTLIQESSK